MNSNNGIITVLGKDKVGIIAEVCVYLSKNGINVLDISQTIVQGYFNMMMIVDMKNGVTSFEEIHAGLTELGEKIGVEIKIQHESIFDSMHRV